jgi:hypothetical protein
MTDLDYYQILLVEPDATADEIREAYYNQIQMRYAQRGKDIETAVHIQQVSEAYMILGNPYRRASYDLERLESTAREQAGKEAAPSAQSASFLCVVSFLRRAFFLRRVRSQPSAQWYLLVVILMLGVGAILSAVVQGLYWLPVVMIVMLCVLMNLLAILLTRHSGAKDIASVGEEKKQQLQT